MTTDHHYELGRKGEDAAGKFLRKKGYRIIEKNYRVVGVEFDIIAQHDDTLCFVEVKTRSSDYAGFPQEFVDERKRKRLIRGARVVSERRKFSGLKVRFDIVSVLFRGNQCHIDHLENAFEES